MIKPVNSVREELLVDIPHIDNPSQGYPWILGLGIGGHDAAAALVRNGEVIAMGEQERFSRNKRAYHESPAQAAAWCLEYAGISLDDIAVVALGTDYQIKNSWKGLTDEELAQLPPHDCPQNLFPTALFGTGPRPPIVPVRHHLAHAASAYYISGFEDAAILVIDNQGEDSSTTLAHGVNGTITELESYEVKDSLGLFYRSAAQFSGVIGKYKSVGKLMGLASYGIPNQPMPIELIDGVPLLNGLPEVPGIRNAEMPPARSQQMFEFFTENCFPYTAQVVEEPMAYANFAASVQQAFETAVLGICKRLKQLTGSDRLVLAGGCALNCSANGKIVASNLFNEIYVQPVAHDAGVSLGAALEMERLVLGRAPQSGYQMDHAYLGPKFSTEQAVAAARKQQLPFEVLEQQILLKRVAHLLAEGRTVGWFQGRAEVGPRALGARSLLGDPRQRQSLVKLNQIKSREMWRPLAPSVLEEAHDTWFESGHASPFMIVAGSVRPERRSQIPAVVHVDGSARAQAVSNKSNPRYWQLIHNFEQITGIPLVINTSFNVAGEPVVHTPENAIADFLTTELDVLVIENMLLEKTNMTAASDGSEI